MIYKDLLRSKLDDIAFLELKEGASIKIRDKEFFGYLPLAILNSKLITLVKNEIEDIPVEYFLEGTVYSLSLGAHDDYRQVHLDFIKSITKDIKGYLFKYALENISKGNYLETCIYLNLMIEEGLQDDKVLFTLGQALENLDISLLDENKKNAYAIEIMNTYEQVLNMNEAFSLAHYKLGYIYKEFGQFIKSKLSFEKVLQLDDNPYRLEEVRGQLDELQSEIKKEEAVLDINSGKYQEALKKLLDVNIETRDDLYHYHLSLCYLNLNDVDMAYDSIRKAIEINDVNIYHNQLAIVYQELGDMDAAKKEIEDTIDKFGPDYYLNFNLATIQYNQQEIEAAIGNFEIAYEISPNPELGEIIDQLKKLLGM